MAAPRFEARERPRASSGLLLMFVASVACLATGFALAARAPRFGRSAPMAETVAGTLLILGLALIGFGLPVFR